ncbi:MAG: hypothetical protein IT384_05415 [Deltaproteobacteria bacterium]|nr:hypothetical protein [Deltaproteobacteria bacterium]
MRRAAALAVCWAACMPACSGTTGECQTTQDCADKGTQLVCVNTACVQRCERDLDCRDPDAPTEDNGLVCENRQCIAGCPTTSCGGGETCAAGRCVFYQQSFEAAAGQMIERVDLAELGFNRIAKYDGADRVTNRATVVAYQGASGCDPRFGDPARCGGFGADGSHYLMVSRQPIPAVSKDASCGACRCCLECRDAGLRPGGDSLCADFGVAVPSVAMCFSEPPDECKPICSECDACPARPEGTFGQLLGSCELQASAHLCLPCADYQARCGDRTDGTCAGLRDACFACRQDPNGTACGNQGRQGCYEVPLHSPRSNMTEDDQAIDSPAISLAGATGDVVLDLSYLPFDMPRCWKRVSLDQPADQWPLEAEVLSIQLCAGSCEQGASWVDAELAPEHQATARKACGTGSPIAASRAVLPREEELENGLGFGQQSGADWTPLRVVIPEAMRTDSFRFRLHPRLGDNARIGIDRIMIRRRP